MASEEERQVKTVRVAFVAASNRGGAGRGVARIVDSINLTQPRTRVEAEMFVIEPEPQSSRQESEVVRRLNPRWLIRGKILEMAHQVANGVLALLGFSRISLPIVGSGTRGSLEKIEADLLVLCWLGNRSLSFAEIAGIKKPFLVRYSDMWPLLPLGHYSRTGQLPSCKYRWSVGSLLNRLLSKKWAAFSRAAGFIAPSRWIYQVHVASKRYPTQRLAYIPNAISTKYWRPRTEVSSGKSREKKHSLPTICFVVPGSFRDRRKGADLLRKVLREIDSFLAMNRYSERIRLVAIGRGKLKRKYSGLEIVQTNEADDASLREIYQSSDLMICTTRVDNSPNTLIEAIACGCPVVAFGTSGIPEIIVDGVSGRIVRPFDVGLMAETVIGLISNPDLLKKLRSSSATWAQENFSQEKIGEAYAKEIRFVLGGGLAPNVDEA